MTLRRGGWIGNSRLKVTLYCARTVGSFGYVAYELDDTSRENLCWMEQ
uniref:Uncharacterized protein n=1 Tax=Peronospora matthiolae TaxID=2874970 RepID=A0AAV1UYD9_9STRA